MSEQGPRLSWIGWCILGGLVAYSVAHYVYSAIYFALGTSGGDFRSAFPGPLLFRLVETWPSLAKDWIRPWFFTEKLSWNYGPVLHFLTAPLVFAESSHQAMTILLLVNHALIAVTFCLWVRLLFGQRPGLAATLGLACLWLNYFPLLEALTGREIEIFELFLITASIWCLRTNRQGFAGIAIGLAAMTKFLPVILVPYLFIKGFRKAGWIACGLMLVIAGIAQMLLGFEHSLTFRVFTAEAQAEYVATGYSNQSLMNLLHKTFTRFDMHVIKPETLYPRPLWILGTLVQTAVLAACGWFLLRWRRSRFVETEVALLLLVMILVPPHSNTYYLVFALPALSIGLAAWISRPQAISFLPKLAWGAAIALSGFLVPVKCFEPITGLPGVVIARIWQLYSLPAFGAIFAALAIVDVHQALRRDVI